VTGARAGRVAPAAPRLAPGEIEEFAEAIERRFGHQQDARRMVDLTALLEDRLRAAGAESFAVYRRLLERADDAEWTALAPLLTVPETYFFRMPEHFEALALDALPAVLERNKARRSLRLLSAGCASGEEAYSLRILLYERFPQLAGWRVQIVGVDLSEAALERARAGEYNAWSLRATSEVRRRANFTAAGKLFRLRPEVRVDVEFRRENLLAPAPADEAPYDIIFCRNVLIYFSEQAIREAVSRLMARLAPQGYLFLGPAESLRGYSRDFSLCHRHDSFFYRLKPGARLQAIPPRDTVRAATGTGQRERPRTAMPRDNSWFEAIRSSSERLAGLVAGEAPAPASRRTAARAAPAARPTSRTQWPVAEAAAAPVHKSFAELVAEEQFAQALALLDAGPPAARDAEGVRLLRAIMLTNLGQHAEAAAECKTLLAADDLNVGAHFLLGLCREQAGELNEAAEQMRTVTYLDPGFPMAHLHRGLLARRRGDREAATESFRLALKAVEDENPERLQLFGGGFSREGLRQVCMRELARLQPAEKALQPAQMADRTKGQTAGPGGGD
jgi:chemotaxis protein methyltransferase CheR